MGKEYKYKELETLVLMMNKEDSYIPRLQKELDFIQKRETSEFFLEAFEIVTILNQNNIIIGPANGYANSSLVNFILGLTTIDPIKYDLICENYFNLKPTYLGLNISHENSILKKLLRKVHNPELIVNTLPILKQYQKSSLKIDYKFDPKKLKTSNLDIDLSKAWSFRIAHWDLERQAMTIKDENDLINSIGISRFGIKGFLLSKILQNKHITFSELTSTNKLLLFQEQWITLISKLADLDINQACKIKSGVDKLKYSIKNFAEHFPTDFDRETINYLYQIAPVLPSKAHTVAESHMLSLELNFKRKKNNV